MHRATLCPYHGYTQRSECTRYIIQTVTYLEYLGWGVPQLFPRPSFILPVQSVPLRDLFLEFHQVSECPKVYMLWRGDDGRTFREIAVVWVIQRVLDVVSNEHLDAPRRVFACLQVVGCDAFVVDMLRIGNIVKIDLGVEVEFLSLLRFGAGGRRSRGREEAGRLKTGQSPSTPDNAPSRQDHGGRFVRDRSRIWLTSKSFLRAPDVISSLLVKQNGRKRAVRNFANHLGMLWSRKPGCTRLKFQSDVSVQQPWRTCTDACSQARIPYYPHMYVHHRRRSLSLVSAKRHLRSILAPESLRCRLDGRSDRTRSSGGPSL